MSSIAKSEVMQWHDKAAPYMHWKISKAFNLLVTDNWYNHNPENGVGNDHIALPWDMQVRTDKEVEAYKPDIIINDHTNNTCQLIDATVPSHRSLSIKTDKLK